MPPFCEVFGRLPGGALSWPAGPLPSVGNRPRFFRIVPFRPKVPGSASLRPRYRVVFFHSPPSPVVYPRRLSF